MRPERHHPAGDHGHGLHHPLPLTAIPQGTAPSRGGGNVAVHSERGSGLGHIPECEEQSNEKAFSIKRNRSQAKIQRPNNSSSKKEKANAFFQGKCRRCGSTVHTLNNCKVSADVECRNCNKAGHLAKICASHIFSPLTAEQQRRRRMVANLIEQGEESDEEEKKRRSSPSRDASATRPQYTDAGYHSPVCVPSG